MNLGGRLAAPRRWMNIFLQIRLYWHTMFLVALGWLYWQKRSSPALGWLYWQFLFLFLIVFGACFSGSNEVKGSEYYWNHIHWGPLCRNVNIWTTVREWMTFIYPPNIFVNRLLTCELMNELCRRQTYISNITHKTSN